MRWPFFITLHNHKGAGAKTRTEVNSNKADERDARNADDADIFRKIFSQSR